MQLSSNPWAQGARCCCRAPARARPVRSVAAHARALRQTAATAPPTNAASFTSSLQGLALGCVLAVALPVLPVVAAPAPEELDTLNNVPGQLTQQGRHTASRASLSHCIPHARLLATKRNVLPAPRSGGRLAAAVGPANGGEAAGGGGLHAQVPAHMCSRRPGPAGAAPRARRRCVQGPVPHAQGVPHRVRHRLLAQHQRARRRRRRPAMTRRFSSCNAASRHRSRVLSARKGSPNTHLLNRLRPSHPYWGPAEGPGAAPAGGASP